MDPSQLLTTEGAALAAIALPILVAGIRRALPSWPLLAGQGPTLTAVVALLVYLGGWALDGHPDGLLARYLLTALGAAGGGTVLHTVAFHGPERRAEIAEQEPFAGEDSDGGTGAGPSGPQPPRFGVRE